MTKPLPPSRREGFSWAALAGAVVLAAGLFFLIPLTQAIESWQEPDMTAREMKLSAPPPPEQPPPPPPEKEPEPPKPKPPQRTEQEPISLTELELSLQPGASDALAMGQPGNAFASAEDLMADIQEVFSFQDVQQPPRLLHVPPITFPRELIRRGVREGKVVLILRIDVKGRAEIERIVSATHRELVPVARRAVQRARFSISRIDGEPVPVRGRWPLILRSPR